MKSHRLRLPSLKAGYGTIQFVDCEGLSRGIALFNTSAYFEAHEVLEDVWREAPAGEKKFLQGLIQIAVGLHHHSQGNVAGACSLLTRGAGNLEGCPEGFAGIDIASLRTAALAWSRCLRESITPPPPPRIKFREQRGRHPATG